MTRTTAVLCLVHGLVLCLVLAGAACSSGPGGRTLSFAQMQSLNPGVSADWILEEFPFASGLDRGPDGKVRSMTYGVTDPLGKGQRVVLTFDANGVLTEKQYTGPLVRPPPPQ